MNTNVFHKTVDLGQSIITQIYLAPHIISNSSFKHADSSILQLSKIYKKSGVFYSNLGWKFLRQNCLSFIIIFLSMSDYNLDKTTLMSLKCYDEHSTVRYL